MSGLFKAVIDNFTLIPKVRTTQASKFLPRAKRQLDNQSQLAWELKRFWNGNSAIDYPVEIIFSVHLPHRRRVDIDNLLKSIMDALQYAGIIENDSIIKGICRSRIFHDGASRVEVSLKRQIGRA